MKISIFGSGKFVERMAKDLAIEKNKIRIYLKEDRQSQRLMDLERVQIIPYGDYHELLDALGDLSREDAILLLEDQDQDNLFLARIFSGLAEKIHLVVHDRKKYDLLNDLPDILPHASIHCPSLVKAGTIQKLYYEDKGLPTQVFEDFQLSLLKYPIEDQEEFVGRKVKDIGAFEDMVLIGIRRDREILVPNGMTELRKNDRIHLIGTTQAIRRFKRRHHVYRGMVQEGKKSFLIYGVDPKSLAIGQGLLEKDADVSFIWTKSFSPKKWAQIMPQARYTSIQGKTLMEAMKDLEWEKFDGFIASSPHDGDNIMAALVAYNLGIRSTALFIEDESMLFSLDTEKVSAVYTGNQILAQRIKRTIRGPKDLSFHLHSTSLEIYEIRLKAGVEALDKTIEDLDLPKGFLIGGILRQGSHSLIPKGNVRLKEGDEVLVFTLPEVAYSLGKFLQKEPKTNLFTELLSLY